VNAGKTKKLMPPDALPATARASPGIAFRGWSARRLVKRLMTAAATGLLFCGLTMDELRKDPKLTPARFASFFKGFEYRFHEEVQPWNDFLATQSGDCDDYATLADKILREKGFNTRLIAVRMPGLVHVVCYVEETQSYLDYNLRTFFVRTASCKSSLEEIAKKVARSLDAGWTSASEFTYDGKVKRLVSTVAKLKS
jgi:hypothetical protein